MPASKSANEPLDALIVAAEPVDVYQVLPDPFGVATLRQSQLNSFLVGFAGAGRQFAAW
jgi:hypothetical protein